ncbi:MAG: PASTA domain-containing protein [Chitinophagales bacterium]
MSRSKKKEAEKVSFLRFLISKVFWVNILSAMVVFVIILWLVLLFVQRYSRHSESQTVPDLVGVTSAEAENTLQELDLEYAIMDSTYAPDQRPLAILNQDPPAGSKVKSGRKIYVTVNMAKPPDTEIPFIEIGTSYISVREILESHGLLIGNVTYKPFEYKDVFLDMRLQGEHKSLQSGSKIPKGSRIDIVLGNGLGDTKILIPDLRGLTYSEAVNLIQLKDLSLGSVIASGTITDTLDAFVVKQYPAALEDRYVNLGSMIDIWISDEPDTIKKDLNDP